MSEQERKWSPDDPLRCDSCRKSAAELGVKKLMICGKCKSAPYCSANCQKTDYSKHKQLCNDIASGKLSRQYLADLQDSTDKDALGRTEIIAMEELQAWTQIHNIKTLSVAAWWALDLVTDIERRKTHMLVLILSRTKSSNPVTFYELVEAQVVDTPQLKRMYKNMSTSPRKVLRPWEEHYRTSGHIGAMMLLTFEQMPGTKLTVADLLPGLDPTMKPKPTSAVNPLGVFEMTRKTVSKIPPAMTRQLWLPSLKNALKGGTFSPSFQKMPEAYFSGA